MLPQKERMIKNSAKTRDQSRSFFLFKQFWKDCSSSFVHHSEPFHSQDLISNSPFRLLYNSYDVSLENLVLDQLLIPLLIFVFFLITCLLDIVLISRGEILSR